MAEIKRTFEGAKQNRDIDDRLLPSGQYRYARNINIGESEGGDIGALENLKGNELIAGQDAIQGTTIGSVRDPNNDRIYWFTTNDTEDAVYEYDEAGGLTTILREPKAREAELPTCAPDLQSRITEPRGTLGTKPDLPPNPPQAVAGCLDSTATNYNPAATYQGVTCTFPPPPTPAGDPVARITGLTAGVPGTAVTLSAATSSPGTITGGAAATITGYTWSTGETTETISVDGAEGDTVLVTLTVTNSGGATSPSVSHSVLFSSNAFTFGVSTTDSIDNATSTGDASISGAVGVDSTVSVTSGIAADSGFAFANSANLVAGVSYSGNEDGSDLTLTQNGASAVLSGTVDMAGSAVITWSGTDTVAVVPLNANDSSISLFRGLGFFHYHNNVSGGTPPYTYSLGAPSEPGYFTNGPDFANSNAAVSSIYGITISSTNLHNSDGEGFFGQPGFTGGFLNRGDLTWTVALDASSIAIFTGSTSTITVTDSLGASDTATITWND